MRINNVTMARMMIRQLIEQQAIDDFLNHSEHYPMEGNIPTEAAYERLSILLKRIRASRSKEDIKRDDEFNISKAHYTAWIEDAFNEHIGEGGFSSDIGSIETS